MHRDEDRGRRSRKTCLKKRGNVFPPSASVSSPVILAVSEHLAWCLVRAYYLLLLGSLAVICMNCRSLQGALFVPRLRRGNPCPFDGTPHVVPTIQMMRCVLLLHRLPILIPLLHWPVMPLALQAPEPMRDCLAQSLLHASKHNLSFYQQSHRLTPNNLLPSLQIQQLLMCHGLCATFYATP